MKKKKLFIGIIIALIIVLLAGGYGVGSYFVNYALSPVSNSDERNVDEDTVIEKPEDDEVQILANEEVEIIKGETFEKGVKDASITSNDSLNLKGKYKLQEEEETDKWAILIHGYKSSYKNMMPYGDKYYDEGYNVLLPSNRAHDDSEGDYIGMGWLDKDDIACWVEWIKAQNPDAKIILHGVSMGGATALMASGDNLDNVVGYIDDCGYTSVWDIFASELDARFSLPTFPVLNISALVANMKAGYDFKEASALEQVKKSKQPILFIHGENDDFVPVSMAHELYEAANCEKELFLVEPAGHAEAKNYDPEKYWYEVFTFIEKNINI